MTDNDIIKALECCAFWGECTDCPYDDIEYKSPTDNCTYNSTKDALDLINRQQAEIERLEREIEDLESTQEISPEAKYLVYTKADKVISLLNELNKSQEQIKSEAIKDFAERLKEKRCGGTYPYVLVNDIDNLVEEMTVNYESSKNDVQRKEKEI